MTTNKADMIDLIITKRTDTRLLSSMAVHYSAPKGFVGRNICYSILYDGIYYGHIVSGSSTRFLPGRNEYFGATIADLNNIINNIFFHIEKVDEKYPIRNFGSAVLSAWRSVTKADWYNKYGNDVIGFESLVELPRTGDIYLRDGWLEVGQTKGYSCKRIGGIGTDTWSGKRIWNTKDLRPKRVFCRF